MTVGALGYAGDDTIDMDVRNDAGAVYLSIDGGDGDDNLSASASGGGDFSGPVENNVRGGGGSDSITIEAGTRNSAYGGDGGDTIVISGGAGAVDTDAEASNFAHGGDGADSITARLDFYVMYQEFGRGVGTNVLEGGTGADRLTAIITGQDGTELDAHSELYGGEGADRLSVRGGEGNILTGNQGDDTLIGSAGADRLVGGQDDDLLRGRGGEDVFAFGSIRNGERDRIGDFAIGEDVIDLAYIDANVFRVGNQAFVFSDRAGTGRVWVEDEGQRSVVYADNGRSVLEIALLDGRGVEASDYSASDFLL